MDSSVMTAFQLTLIGWIGGVFIVNYATRDLFVSEERSKTSKPHFVSEYDELMWLADKQKGSLSEEETLRFYELRDRWPEMHSDVRIR
jgi:hypothetical protein